MKQNGNCLHLLRKNKCKIRKMKNVEKFKKFEKNLNESINNLSESNKEKEEVIDNSRKTIKFMGDVQRPTVNKKENKFVGFLYKSLKKAGESIDDAEMWLRGIFFEYDDKKGAEEFIDDVKNNGMKYKGKTVSDIELLSKDDIEDIERKENDNK